MDLEIVCMAFTAYVLMFAKWNYPKCIAEDSLLRIFLDPIPKVFGIAILIIIVLKIGGIS